MFKSAERIVHTPLRRKSDHPSQMWSRAFVFCTLHDQEYLSAPLAKRLLVTSLNRPSLRGFVDPGTQRAGINVDDHFEGFRAQLRPLPEPECWAPGPAPPQMAGVYSTELVQCRDSEHRSAGNQRAMMVQYPENSSSQGRRCQSRYAGVYLWNSSPPLSTWLVAWMA
ncbi:hypothetical protein FDECE_16448 [Fusarium decemcellulare]|nr:hypothetical protein FDECE_16448 [Fusarium decemcellulare]